MVWFHVDDRFHDHPKAQRAGVAAIGLWTLAGSWVSDNLETYDGFVPQRVVSRWDRNWRSLARRLEEVGLWVPGQYDGEDGWWFNDWKHCNPDRAEVLEKRAAARERMARVRANKRASSQEVPSAQSSPIQSVPFQSFESNTTLGGQRTETLDPADARCTEHRGMDQPPNCRGCMNARIAAEKARDRARLEIVHTRHNCPDCHGTGWTEHHDGTPAGHCTHQRSTA